MPHVSLQRDMRDFEELDEFVCVRFCLLPLTSSVSEINSLTRRLMRMTQRRFAYASTRELAREALLCQWHIARLLLDGRVR
jgi:hypothetical protein